MKRFFLTSAVCVFAFSPAVMGQGSTITVIHEDGSQDVIELGGSAPQKAPAPTNSTKSVIFKTPSEGEPPVAAPTPESATAPESESIVPRAERVEEPQAEPEVEPAPVPKAQPKAKPKPKPKTKPKKKAKAKSKTVKKDPLALIPPRKPHRRALPAGEPITKEKAHYNAMSEAPPDKDVQVIPREGASGLEYVVIFKTEDGAYEVIVDGVSGTITSSGNLKADQPLTKPGHLPAR